jgi:hypothetical protein
MRSRFVGQTGFFGFSERVNLLRVGPLRFHITISGELSVSAPIDNLSADDRVFVVTKKSGVARVGKIRIRPDETDEVKIVPFNPINPEWDPIFIGALRREGEELYLGFIPAPATDDLGPKLKIELSVPLNDLVAQANPQHQDGKPVELVELPSLVVDGAGKVDPAALITWVVTANGLAAQGRPGLNFGNLVANLPWALGVSHVHYTPRDAGYERGVFPEINGVSVFGRAREEGFMIDVEWQANRSARGVFFPRRNLDPAEEAVERIEVKNLPLPYFIRQLEEVVVDLTKRMVLTVVGHDLGTVIVDNMEVDSIKRVCKKGKKLYRIFLKKAEEEGNLNSRVNAGMYRRCSFWFAGWATGEVND